MSTALVSKDRTVLMLLLIAGVAGLVAVIYAVSFATLAELWKNNDHRHGALAFPIAAFLLWRSRFALSGVTLRPWGWGLVLIFGLVVFWWLSRAVGLQATEHLAAILLIPATVATLLGTALAKRALFPLLFLIAAVPLGDALVPYLMQVTADVSAALLRATGVPVYREGQFLALPGGNFEVADVCSGARYLISGTMIALLFGYVTFASNLRRSLFVAIAAGALILANGFRAYVVMFVASASDMRYFVGRDHIYFGWLLFAFVVVALFWGGARFADTGVTVRDSSTSAVRRADVLLLVSVFGLVMLAITAQPFQNTVGRGWAMVAGATAVLLVVLFMRFARSSGERIAPVASAAGEYRDFRAAAVVSAACIALVTGPALANRSSASSLASFDRASLPTVEGCDATGDWLPPWRPTVDSPDVVIEGAYTCRRQVVSVFIAGYAREGQGREIISERSSVLPDDWRTFAVNDSASLIASDGGEITVNRAHVRERNVEVWYWYKVGEGTATTGLGVKARQLFGYLTHGRSDTWFVLMVTSLDNGEDASTHALQSVGTALTALMKPDPRARE